MQYIFGTKIAPQKLPEIQNIETADVVEVTKQMVKYYLRSIVIKTTELSNFILMKRKKIFTFFCNFVNCHSVYALMRKVLHKK